MKTSLPSKNDDGSVSAALSTVALSGLGLTVASHMLFGLPGLVSTGLGAALAVANLWAIGRLVRAMFGSRGASFAPLGAIKLLALFLVLYILISKGIAEVIPLAFGYLALPIGIVLAQLRPQAARGEH